MAFLHCFFFTSMKKQGFVLFFYWLLLIVPSGVAAQEPVLIDSLLKQLPTARDTARVNVLNNLCWEYRNSQPDKGLEYGQQALDLATRLSFKGGMLRAYSRIGVIHMQQGRNPQAKDFFQKALKIGQQTNNRTGMASSYMNLGA